MESHRDQIDFAAELRDLRPTPRPAFAAQLDARVAAGFAPAPTGELLLLSRAGLRGAWTRLRTAQGRRLLAPAGAMAALVIAGATAVVVISEGGSTGGGRSAPLSKVTQVKPFSRDVTPVLPASAEGQMQSAERAGRTHASPGVVASVGAAPEQARSGEAHSAGPKAFDGNASYNASLAAGAKSTSESNGRTVHHFFPFSTEAPVGPYASGVSHRSIERSAQIVLGADAADVRGDAAKVFDAVQAFHGIVLRSSISDGGEGQAGATFNLLIPSGKLGEAMAAFSGIADVRSRHESGVDVTAPTINLGERLQDARAKVASLLTEVAGAETEAEREAAEEKLRAARRQVATLRSRLTDLRRQTHLSSVLLRIETGGAAGGSDGSWGVADGLHEAGHILAVAAGVTVIGLAIVTPLALIVLLVWLARRAWIGRSRERALD